MRYSVPVLLEDDLAVAGCMMQTPFGVAAERRWNNVKGFRDVYLKVKARVWPRLSCVCHARSTAARGSRLHQLNNGGLRESSYPVSLHGDMAS